MVSDEPSRAFLFRSLVNVATLSWSAFYGALANGDYGIEDTS